MSRDFQHPDFGNTGQVRSFGTLQRARHQGYLDLETAIAALEGRHGLEASRSQAVDAVRVRLERLKAMAADLAHVTDTWQRASTTYADDLDSLSHRAEAARNDLHRGQRQQYALFDTPGGTGGGFYTATAESAEELINSANHELYNLGSQRDVMDAYYAGSLTHVGFTGQSVNWAGMVDLYAGATSVADIRARRQELVDETAGALAAVLASGKTEDVEALTRLLNRMSVDASLAGQFWIDRGDQALPALAAIIYSHDEDFAHDGSLDAVLRDADALRHSIAAASQAWGQLDASSFAEALLARRNGLSGGTAPDEELAGLGFLFGDTEGSPISAALTLEVADLLDGRERSGITFDDTLAAMPLSLYLHELARADGATGDFSRGQAADPISQVFETLGLYPDEAWSWLNDSGTITTTEGNPAQDRIDYWFSRDWASDGWQGIGALFEGSMRHDGGLVTGPPNTEAWDAHCDAVTRMIDELAAGMDDTRPDAISDQAGGSIGLGLAEIMPVIDAGAEYSSSVEGHIATDRAVPGYSDLVSVPYVHESDLSKVIGLAALSPEGFAALRLGVTNTQDLMIQQAQAEGSVAAWDHALASIADLEGQFVGSIGGAEIVEARFADEDLSAQFDLMKDVLGLLPIPSADGVVGWAIGEMKSAAIDGAIDGATNNEDLAWANFESGAYCGEAALRSYFERLKNSPEHNLGALDLSPEQLALHLDLAVGNYSESFFGEGSKVEH